MDIISILQQVRGTGDIGVPPVDGIYHDLTIKTTEDDNVTSRIGAGIYGSIRDMYAGITPILVDLQAVLAVSGIIAEIVSLATDKPTLDSLYADKATLDSIFADKLTLDSLVADKAILDSLYASKAVIDRVYASITAIDRVYASITNIDDFVEHYLGPLAVEPTLVSHPALSTGALYFDTVILAMRVYDGVAWSDSLTLTESSISTLTNKTMNDISNSIHADVMHFEIEALENLVKGDVLEVDGTSDVVLKVRKHTSLQNPVIGIMESDLALGATGSAMGTGVFKSLSNTGSWVVGDILYPNGTGGLTKNPSILATNYSQPIAYVVKANVNFVTLIVNVHSGHETANLVGYANTASGLVATNVQAAIDEVEGRLDTTESSLVTAENKLAGIEAGATADQIASEVPNTPTGNIAATDVQAAINELDTDKQAISEKGVANGYAPLDAAALIPAQYLPSYVDDVLEVATYSALPVTGELNKIYIVVADETSGGNTSSYRWTGTVYAMVSDTLTAADVKALYESNADTNVYDDAAQTKIGYISVTQPVDLDTMESDIAANNAKITNVTTDLGYIASTTDGTVTSSDGTDATIPLVVSGGNAGLVSGSDKAKLDGIESGATADQTATEIETLYEGIVDTNKYTDADKAIVTNITANALAFAIALG